MVASSMDIPRESQVRVLLLSPRVHLVMMLINAGIQTSTIGQQEMPIGIRDTRCSHLKLAMT
jgi:hypothetical protein